MNRQQATQKILEAKVAKGLTWEEIANVGEHSETWIVTALLGQAAMSYPEAKKIGELLELETAVIQALTYIPKRGDGIQMPPTDPVLYRFYEMLLVYGPAMKELIQEKFGEGIMSAVDFAFDIQKEENPKGDRVVLTLNGKFLPYQKW